MTTPTLETLEKRIIAIEQEMVRLQQEVQTSPPQNTPPRWKGIIGVFKDDPLFAEAERLGREWRQSQREDYDDDADTPA